MEEGKKEVERCSSGKKTKGHKLTFPPKMGPLHLDLLFVRPKTLQLPKGFLPRSVTISQEEKNGLSNLLSKLFRGKSKISLLPSPPQTERWPSSFLFPEKADHCKKFGLPIFPFSSSSSSQSVHSEQSTLTPPPPPPRRFHSTLEPWGGRSVVSRFCLLAKVERPTEEAAAVWPKCLTSCCMVVRQKRKKSPLKRPILAN